MGERFSSEFFSANRQRLRELFTGTAPIVVTANGVLQRGADINYKFAQDANFWYLTGIDEPDLLLVMDRDKEYLIVPGRSASHEAFAGIITDETLIRRSGVQTIYDDKAGWEKLGARLKKVKHVATVAPPPAFIEFYSLYTNPARAALVQQLKTHNADINLLDLSPHLVRMRMIKQPAELDAIQVAVDITLSSLRECLRSGKLQKYSYEYELEADISRGFRRRGADGHSFDPVVAGGPRACTMHYLANNNALAADELVLVDVGAEVEHYAADIARTVSLKAPSRRQQAVHAAVLDAEAFAFSLLRPGVSPRDYEQQVEHYMGEKLRELSVLKTIDSASVRKFFPHRTSHFVGLNAHDAGDYERPLETGTVLAVETGIYIAQEGIGVRIEDNVLITDTGIKILSDKLPRGIS